MRKALSFFLTADTYQRASTWTYAELLAEITRAANALHTFGVSAGLRLILTSAVIIGVIIAAGGEARAR